MPVDIQIINKFQQMLNRVLDHNDIIDVDICKQLEASLKKATQDISEAVANNVLFRLHEKKPSRDSLQALISIAPSALFVKNKDGLIPLQQAYTEDYPAFENSIKYVGWLAKEGVKYDDNNTRGGLLLEDLGSNPITCSLECLASYRDIIKIKADDLAYVEVMKELKEANLLTAQDIRDYDLLYWACHTETQHRFQFLSDFYPEDLKMFCKGRPLFHTIIQEEQDEASLALFLRAAVKHHPKDIGLLFQLDNDNNTTFDTAVSKHGKDPTFKIIRECIPQDTHLPILHHVIKFAPQYMDDFAYYYHDTGHLRDDDGRTLCQVRLECGNVTLKHNAQFLIGMSPEQVEEIDPVTDLYPFMMAASGDKSDLDTIYYLLKRKPSLAYGDEESESFGGRKHRSKRRKLK